MPRDELLAQARQLHAYLSENREVLSYRYSLSVRVMGRDDMLTEGSGTVSGFTMDGCHCSISGGNGECYVNRYELNEDGTSRIVERIDVRQQKRISTDNWGDISISRRRIDFSFPDQLAECIEFLDSVSDVKVTLYSYDVAPSLRDVLQYYAEGGGGEDWALDVCNQGGDKWRQDLIGALSEPELQQYLGSTIQLLLLCFSDTETRSAIMAAIDRQPETDRNSLALLYAAYTQAIDNSTSSQGI
ncbi:MAG: hypothetical protein KDA63_00890 [Planctomycetales bacterium]|nr:hypothetical protein [Planctomycetales bacterium]